MPIDNWHTDNITYILFNHVKVFTLLSDSLFKNKIDGNENFLKINLYENTKCQLVTIGEIGFYQF